MATDLPLPAASLPELDARADAARTAGDRPALVSTLLARAEALALSDPERARRDAVEARRMARALRDPALDVLASSLEVLLGWLDGRPPDLRLPPDDPAFPRGVRLRRALAERCLAGPSGRDGTDAWHAEDPELGASPTLSALWQALRASEARANPRGVHHEETRTGATAPATATALTAAAPTAPSGASPAASETLRAVAAAARTLASSGGGARPLLEALLGSAGMAVPLSLPELGAFPRRWQLTALGERTLLQVDGGGVTVFEGPRLLPPSEVLSVLEALAPLMLSPREPLATPAREAATRGDGWLHDPARLDAELCAGRLTFFPDVRAAFAGHLLTRDVLQAALERALVRHAGHYVQVASSWGIDAYQRWMDFLRRNGILLNFRAFRGTPPPG
jgi:hypothetical protein